jgi:hypothetical protein
MLTPLEDIDIIYLLPYLSLYDIAQVIRIRKHLPLEYKSKLDSFKWKTLCDLSFHTQLPWSNYNKLPYLNINVIVLISGIHKVKCNYNCLFTGYVSIYRL